MYEFTSRVRYSEVEPDLRMSMSALINRFQDASVFHSESIGRGPQPIGSVKHAWIIVSWQIILNRMPSFSESVTTATWGWKFRGMEGDRDFTIKNENGEILAMAASRWIYFDFERQRPMRVPEAEVSGYGIDPPLEIERAPRKIKIPETEPLIQEQIRIGKEHLDNNKHVNNLQYIEMALEAVPDGAVVKEIRVEYAQQAYLGDTLTPKYYMNENGCIVTLERSESEICAIVELFYNRRDSDEN